MPTIYDYGPAELDLVMVQKRDFSMIVDVDGDRDADTFAASLRPAAASTPLTAFTVAVGAYAAPSTPVTITLTDTTLDGIEAGDYVWDLKWTASGGNERQLVAGAATVLPAYTA